MLKLGWKAGPEQYPPVELLDYAVIAEQAGFDAIDVSDHFHPWAEIGQACFTWTWLGAAAVKTSNIHLGTGVTCPLIRYHPAIIAQAAATLACFAPGRSFLGVGTGEALNEYSATGQWPEYKIRQEQLAEAIELIRALWTGEKTSYGGVYFQTHQAKLYTRPDEAIPLYVSTLVPESAYFAGQYGDGLMTVGGQEPEVYRQIIKSFEAGAREAGKDPAKMPKLIELGVAYAEDEDAAIDYRKRYWAGTFVPAMFTQKLYTPKMSEANGAVVGSDIVKQKACISADLADHIKFARQYIELGFDQLYFHSAGPDQQAFLTRFGQDVLPELRKIKEGKSKKAAQGKK